jgi:hypothetical protein
MTILLSPMTTLYIVAEIPKNARYCATIQIDALARGLALDRPWDYK